MTAASDHLRSPPPPCQTSCRRHPSSCLSSPSAGLSDGLVDSAVSMSRDLPTAFSTSPESTLAPQDAVSEPSRPRHLSVLPLARTNGAARLTRGQVASRLGVSVSTVRRLEGDRLHPTVDQKDVRWFDEGEVAALAAELANEAVTKPSRATAATPHTADPRSRGDVAALVFDRLEQRQSLAEIVIGLRVEPETVRALFEQWCLGLTEGQLRMDGEPHMPRLHEIERARPDKLSARLAELPANVLTRISVARFRDDFQHGEFQYALVVELGGFHVSGPCGLEEITRRFGPGGYRVSAYGFDPPGLRWELLVDGLEAA
jgi:hypothetical protein